MTFCLTGGPGARMIQITSREPVRDRSLEGSACAATSQRLEHSSPPTGPFRIRLLRKRRTFAPQIRARARAVVCPRLGPLTISHPAAMPESLWWGRHGRFVLPLGTGAPPGRRGDDARTMLAASSGQGHVRASTGLPTPCRREHSLHVSQSRTVRVRAGGKVNARQRNSALSIRGYAIARWPRFEPWQGGFVKGAANPSPAPASESISRCSSAYLDSGESGHCFSDQTTGRLNRGAAEKRSRE
jgi:hypothetical protein